MKRSQMLEIIEETLHPCNSSYKSSRKETAERLLEVIEQLMLPPERYIPMGPYETVESSWEPED